MGPWRSLVLEHEQAVCEGVCCCESSEDALLVGGVEAAVGSGSGREDELVDEDVGEDVGAGPLRRVLVDLQLRRGEGVFEFDV